MSFYTNNTKADLIFSDIGIVIKSGATIDPFRQNPRLTAEKLHESESIGGIYKALRAKKVSKSERPPIRETIQTNQIKESTRTIPSRIRTGVSIDPKKKQYIEELTGFGSDLERYEDYAEGFSEPDLQEEQILSDPPEPSANTPPQDRYVDIKTY